MTTVERNALIERYLPLAKKLAVEKKKSIPNHISMDDLISVAYYGLVDAAVKHDASKCSFGFYAKLRIMGEITDYLRESCRNDSRYGTSIDYCYNDGTTIADTVLLDDTDNSEEFLEDVSKNLIGVDKTVFSLYYGENLSLKEIGKVIGVSESRVSQILTKSKEIVKEYMVSLAA